MGVLDHRGRRQQHAVAFVGQAVAIEVVGLAVAIGVHLPRRQQVGLPGSDAVGVGFDLLQASRRQQVGKGPVVVGKRKVVRLVERRLECDLALGVHTVAVDQLHQAHRRLAAQVFEVGHFKRLHDDRRIFRGVAVLGQQREQAVFQRQPGVHVVGRVFGLGVDAHRAAGACAFAACQFEHLAQRRDRVFSVVGLIALGHGLLRAQGLDLGQRQVGGEPAGFRHPIDLARGLAVGKLGARRHVGGGRDVGLVPHHEFTVFGGHHIGLDEVDAQLDRAFVGFQRVFRQITAGAAMPDDQRRLAVQRGITARCSGGRAAGTGGQAQEAGSGQTGRENAQ